MSQLAAAWEKVNELDKTTAMRFQEHATEHAAEVQRLGRSCAKLQQLLDRQMSDIALLDDLKKRLAEKDQICESTRLDLERLGREIKRLKSGADAGVAREAELR